VFSAILLFEFITGEKNFIVDHFIDSWDFYLPGPKVDG
jgi:hypothetical protein